MIQLHDLKKFIEKLRDDVNSSTGEIELSNVQDIWVYKENSSNIAGIQKGKCIDEIILTPEENYLIKKLKDKSGLILVVQYPSSDTSISDIDNYSERNKMLMYIIEKIDPSKFTDNDEQDHYSKIQLFMSAAKECLLPRLKRCDLIGDVKVIKPFHTEWEYNIFGGYNGMSLSFELKNFEL